MEKNIKEKHKQTSLLSYFKQNPSNKTSLNENSMDIEPELELYIIEKNPLNPLKTLPLPHKNLHIWPIIRSTFEDFANKKTNSFGEFFKNMRILMAFSCEKPIYENLEFIFSLFSEVKRNNFFEELLPCIGRTALLIETLFKEPLKRLIEGSEGVLMLSKQKIACLIIHMFFCTIFTEFPKEQFSKKSQIFNKNWNFKRLFKSSKQASRNSLKLEKLKCIYHYFERLPQIFDYKIIYLRIVGPLKFESQWISSDKPLQKVHIKDKFHIETYIPNTIQIDFANKFLGGGVLNEGLVQEEIRFCINPELIPSMPLFDCLRDNEAAVFIGTEQYSAYSGYKETFKYNGDFEDPATFIKLEEPLKDIVVLAIDAHKYIDLHRQFTKEEVLREVNKAYIGFFGNGKYPEKGGKRAVATGKWGCGAFKGDVQLKFLIQWLACSESEREMYFYRNGDDRLDAVDVVIERLEKEGVGNVMRRLLQACEKIERGRDKRGVFEVILSII